MTTTPTSAEREAFETHMRSLGYSCMVSQFKPGYMGDNVEEMWRVWQARAAMQAAEPDDSALVAQFKQNWQDNIVPALDAKRKSLLRPAISTADQLPPGCYCPPDKCQAPAIMGRQTPCRRKFAAPDRAPSTAPTGRLTKGEAAAIRRLALDLETTGRITALSEGQEKAESMTKNRELQCALEDVLRSLTEPASVPSTDDKCTLTDAELADHAFVRAYIEGCNDSFRRAMEEIKRLKAAPSVESAAGWISVEDRLPEVDEDGMANVWAVEVGAVGFASSPQAGVTRYHKSLGWQPQGATGWDWIITHWRYFPELPAIAALQPEGGKLCAK